MRGYFYRLVLAFGLASGTLLSSVPASADRDVRDNRRDDRKDYKHDDGPRTAPPQARNDRPAQRKKGYVWVPGQWEWQGRKWVWVAGKWEVSRPGRKFVAPRWEKKGDVYVRVEGSWTDVSAPPPLREEKFDPRPGWTFVRGHWEWDDRDDKWEWVAGKWEKERAGKRWRDGKWEQKNGTWVWVDGGWDDFTVTVSQYPTSRPPNPKLIRVVPKAGWVWVGGRWDWKNGQWVWVDGQYIREKKGERWREGKWEERGGRWEWIEGGWETDRADPLAYPTSAPPQRPREAVPKLTVDQEWIPGRHVWQGGRWIWKSGYIEKKRPGKRFREGKWESRNGRWEWVDEAWDDDVVSPYPTSAPPPPRDDRQGTRAGFTWVAGRWEWKGGKWDWTAGRWEKERADEDWAPGRWEQKNGRWEWIEGSWQKFPRWPKDPPPPAPRENVVTKPGGAWKYGQYIWQRGKYVWIPGVFVEGKVGERHIPNQWVKKGDHYVLVGDRWEKDTKQPTPKPYEQRKY